MLAQNGQITDWLAARIQKHGTAGKPNARGLVVAAAELVRCDVPDLGVEMLGHSCLDIINGETEGQVDDLDAISLGLNIGRHDQGLAVHDHGRRSSRGDLRVGRLNGENSLLGHERGLANGQVGQTRNKSGSNICLAQIGPALGWSGDRDLGQRRGRKHRG